MTTTSPGRSSGTRTSLTQASKASRSMAPVSTKGAIMPRRVSPATKAVVFQWPWGTAMRRRSPRAAQPWVRAMLVLAQVSSMKTSRSGSRRGWLSRQACRRFRTSGRSCSAAWPVFFTRDAVALEEALYRPAAEDEAPFPKGGAQLLDGHVPALLKKAQDRAALTPNRAAAVPWLIPSETADRTRMRKSRESALDITAGLLPPANILNHKSLAP